MTTPPDELGRLLHAVADWRAAGHGVALATVIETWGSAPRRIGAHLAIRDVGLFEGSVSGGCVEGDVITEAIDLIATGQSRLLVYGVADETAWRVGLACGGRIRVLVQPVDMAHFSPGLIARLLAARTAGEAVLLSTDTATGHTVEGTREDWFAQSYAPPLRLAIIGAVHIAQALAPIAAMLGVTPTIIDPRGLFAQDARFEGQIVDPRWPDEALADWRPNAASAVVALTHDPKLDDPALVAALRSDTFYIAALGSRKNHAKRLERLAEAGFGEAALARIHGPAGLDIGAANPPEIALSIAAQMIAAWRGKA